MNTTATYISDLLYRYECVILPGFGAFLTRRQPATINALNNSFYPPKKIVSFNSQLQNNDGLLANYMASVEHISYTDAVAKIQRYVLKIRNELSKSQRVKISGVGEFFNSIENILQFEPSGDVNYLTESFGLSSFVSPTINRELIQTNVPKTTREVYKKETEKLEKKAPLAFTPESRSERPYVKYAAIAAVFIGALGFFGMKYYKDKQLEEEYRKSKMVDTSELGEDNTQEAGFDLASDSSSELDSLALSNDTVADDEAGDTNADIEESISNEEVAEETVESIAYAGKYHIIGGAFRIKDNATRYVQTLKKKGYDARILKKNSYGLHQVVFRSFESRSSAKKELYRIQDNETPDAWLLIQ